MQQVQQTVQLRLQTKAQQNIQNSQRQLQYTRWADKLKPKSLGFFAQPFGDQVLSFLAYLGSGRVKKRTAFFFPTPILFGPSLFQGVTQTYCFALALELYRRQRFPKNFPETLPNPIFARAKCGKVSEYGGRCTIYTYGRLHEIFYFDYPPTTLQLMGSPRGYA